MITNSNILPFDLMILSKKLGKSPEAAVMCASQYGVRMVMHHLLSYRFRTNDQKLWYRRLRYDVFVIL